MLNLRLRDLYKLVQFDTDCCFNGSEYSYFGGSMPTSLPLFHLIIYMMESGMSTEKIQEDLQSLNEFILRTPTSVSTQYEIIRLLYPVYITRFPNIQYISSYDGTYYLGLERLKDGGKVVVKNADGYNGDAILAISQMDIGEAIILFLKRLSISANLSALRLD
ncbi:hypothetical protein [Prevotella jejuni]